MSYNGWTNRETWLVNIWFNPETKADLCMAKIALHDGVDRIDMPILQDMIDLDKINWEELAEHMED